MDNSSILKKAGRKTFREYTENTAVHGVPYLGQKDRYTFERIFWVFVIVTSIYMCGGYISNIWTKWNDTPVIISFSEKSTPVWKFPLPTITICPDVKTKTSIFHYGKYVKEIEEWNQNDYADEFQPTWLRNDQEIMQMFEVNSEICDYNISEIYNFDNKYFNGSFFKTINNINPDYDILFSCRLNSKYVACYDYFDTILTEKGLCYVFNFLNATENIFRENVLDEELLLAENPYARSTKWQLDKGYEEDAINESFPFRSSSPLVEDGLYIFAISKKEDIDFKCSGGSEGFKISFNAPGEIPQVSKRYINIPFNHETLIDITPEMIVTQKNAMKYKPKIRHCYLENERPLYFFKLYNRNNCELECLTNHTFAQCGCVRYFMPRTANMPLCGVGSRECYEKAKMDVISRDFIRLHSEHPEKVLNCNCFPSCKSLSYSFGVTEAELKPSLIEKYAGWKTAEVSIYFKERRFWTSERSKLYGTIEFIAHSGGLMGLFMGISAVSFIEIFYFFILRCGQYIKVIKTEN